MGTVTVCVIVLSLRYLKTHILVQSSFPLLTFGGFKEGVLVMSKPLTLGEMKGKHMILAKRQLYLNVLIIIIIIINNHEKLLKAPKMVFLKVWQGVHYHKEVFWPMSTAFLLFHHGFQHHSNTP